MILTKKMIHPSRNAASTQSVIFQRIGSTIEQLCRWCCCIGGIVLLAGVAVMLASITGRLLSTYSLGAAIIGDNELMEASCVIAAFFFLPWCQLQRGHIAVDIIVNKLNARIGMLIGLISDIAMLAVSGLILWALVSNAIKKYRYNETTMMLEIPIWVLYAICSVGSGLFVLACFVTLSQTVMKFKQKTQNNG